MDPKMLFDNYYTSEIEKNIYVVCSQQLSKYSEVPLDTKKEYFDNCIKKATELTFGLKDLYDHKQGA
jgi:hypothetical protein